MSKKLPNIGELELEVLKILWEHGSSSVFDIGEQLAKGKGYSRSAVRAALDRLLQKRYVKRKKVDGFYHYQATRKRQQVMGVLLTEFIHKVFDGSSASLVQHLASVDVEPEELKEIRRILDDTQM